MANFLKKHPLVYFAGTMVILAMFAGVIEKTTPAQVITDYGPKTETPIGGLGGGKAATGMWRPVIGEVIPIEGTDLFRVPFDRHPRMELTPHIDKVGWAIVSGREWERAKNQASSSGREKYVGWENGKFEVELSLLTFPVGDLLWVATDFRSAK